MGRPRRIVRAGGTYHVYSRVADRYGHQDLFRDDRDAAMLLRILAYTLSRHNLLLRAFCLMGNHFHFMVTCVEAQLSEFMRDFGSVYVREFNHRHEFDGSMFRDRFQSKEVDNTAYEQQLSLYIHRNPVDLGWEECLAAYPLSSLRYFLEPDKAPWWLAPGPILSRFDSPAAYGRAVAAGPRFALGPDASPEEVYESWAFVVLDDILDFVASALGTDRSVLQSSLREHRSDERKVAMMLTREFSDLPSDVLAATFGYSDRTALAHGIAAARQQLADLPELNSLRSLLRRHLAS